MTGRAIDKDEAQELLALAEQQTSTRKLKTPPVDPREYSTWWKLPSHFGNCQNPNCEDPRPRKVEEGNTMVAMVNGSEICRYCFLANVNPTLTT